MNAGVIPRNLTAVNLGVCDGIASGVGKIRGEGVGWLMWMLVGLVVFFDEQ